MIFGSLEQGLLAVDHCNTVVGPVDQYFKKHPIRYELNQINRAVYKSIL